jgi:hypothetical protein
MGNAEMGRLILTCRLLEPIGYITPADAEEGFSANMKTVDQVA